MSWVQMVLVGRYYRWKRRLRLLTGGHGVCVLFINYLSIVIGLCNTTHTQWDRIYSYINNGKIMHIMFRLPCVHYATEGFLTRQNTCAEKKSAAPKTMKYNEELTQSSPARSNTHVAPFSLSTHTHTLGEECQLSMCCAYLSGWKQLVCRE